MRLLFWLILGLTTTVARAQADEQPARVVPLKTRGAKAIYVEALGSSGFNYSLNYDMRFKAGRNGWGFRAGVALPQYTGQVEIYTMPLMLNNVQSARRAALEMGIGVLAAYRRLTYEDHNFVIQRRQSIGFPVVANLGVRFQPLRTGVVWRIYWAPNWRLDQPSSQAQLFWFGTSLGIGFK
jgi:hypothetical protein